jgi:protease PrsW
MLLLIASLAPVVIILFYVYIRDRYDREPLGLLIRALVAGILIVIPVIFVERFLVSQMPVTGRIPSAAYNAFVVAGFTEETFKFLALFFLVWKSPSFNEKFDGIVYAVFISLGFAAVENVMYVMQGGAQTALVRGITAVPAHALFGVTMGYYLGIAHMYSELRKRYLRRALLLPIMLHGIYDFILMIGIEWLMMVFFLYVIFLYFYGMRKMRILSDASIFKPVKAEDDF